MKILLTGATGFIGKNFCKYLKKKNHNILALSRKKSFKNYKNLKFINSSFRISHKKLKIIERFSPEVVVNLGWYGIPNFSKENSQKNLIDQKFFFKKLENITSIKKILSIGSCWEYKKKNGVCHETNIISKATYFTESKFKIRIFLENLCNMKKINFFWLRLFYVYGPYQKKNSLLPSLIYAIKNNKKNPIKSVENTNDFIYVEDVCKLIYKFIENKSAKSGIYNIGSGKLTEVKKIIQIVHNFYNIKSDLKKKSSKRSIFASIKKIKKFDKKFIPSDLKKSIISSIKYYD